MSRPLRLPPPSTTLGLYRHLLRESSYLPSLARPFIDEQIKHRFRSNKDDENHLAERIRDAKHDLRYLRAANHGDLVRMRRVLLRAFGRLGRRRRELILDLVGGGKTAQSEAKEPSSEDKSEQEEKKMRESDWLDRWDTKTLAAFAKSQVNSSVINSPKAALTAPQASPEKNLPTENSWGRPFPAKPLRTKLKKRWKQVAEKVLPPVPKDEWEKIGLVAQGKFEEAGFRVPSRRPIARMPTGDEGIIQPWKWHLYATKPVAVVDIQKSREYKLLSGLRDLDTPTGDPQPLNCHKYTPRLWRRLFAGIWQLTATMEKKTEGGREKLDISWGKTEFRPPTARAAPKNTEFFESLRPDGYVGSNKNLKSKYRFVP
ncbi:hypothetical protein QBC35DRAFT_179918 [Podospora australis]|uniref:LYR motif-containing protein Cup1-like N-terminal domain-containing protein n=1 Tax=Podospora australis TaxID=1536484 RepID=A0AAN6WV08_9PEZI|nr:hypothetical protein QBC35DRAFT_179918 [Podospora australis]